MPICARSAVPTTMPEKKTTSESGAAAAELIGLGGLYAEASALAPKPATSSRAEILGWHEKNGFFKMGHKRPVGRRQVIGISVRLLSMASRATT
jgi:hypothetical protein